MKLTWVLTQMARTTTKPRAQTRRGFKATGSSAIVTDASHKEVKVGGEKNGGTRLIPAVRASRFYPADDVLPPKKSKKVTPRSALRPTITPGTVLILLAGRFRGKRVVFLKQLESGLLLITGPYKINGVPLRRVNQAYVIATSTKVDVDTKVCDSDVSFKSIRILIHHQQIVEKFTDAYFAKEAASGKQSAEAEFFEEGKPKAKAAFPESKAVDQKEIDKTVLAAVKTKENLAKYLKASWGLSKGQFPHQIVF